MPSPWQLAWADAIYEWRSAATATSRISTAFASLVALVRLVLSSIPIGVPSMHNLASDYRFAWRRLRATPLFTAFAIATLALGIGVTTGVYSAVRAVLSPPDGLADVERLVHVARDAANSGPGRALSWAEYQDFSAQQSVFDSLAAWDFARPAVSAAGQTQSANTEIVSGGYFETLGVAAQRGRVLQPVDDAPTAQAVAVISHDAWQRWFDEAPDAVGQTIRINGTAFTVVGIADPTFAGLVNGGVMPTAVWITLSALRALPFRKMFSGAPCVSADSSRLAIPSGLNKSSP